MRKNDAALLNSAPVAQYTIDGRPGRAGHRVNVETSFSHASLALKRWVYQLFQVGYGLLCSSVQVSCLSTRFLCAVFPTPDPEAYTARATPLSLKLAFVLSNSTIEFPSPFQELTIPQNVLRYHTFHDHEAPSLPPIRVHFDCLRLYRVRKRRRLRTEKRFDEPSHQRVLQ